MEKKLGKVGPLVKKNLLQYSESMCFEQARQEWIFVRHIVGLDEDFAHRCELCAQPLYRENFVIENIYNGEQLHLGCNCIYRFIQFAGTTNQEESNQYFNNRLNDLSQMQKLKGLYLEIVKTDQPINRYVIQFQKLLTNFLAVRGEQHLMMGLDNIKIIHQKYFNNADPSMKEVMRIFYALCMPKKIHRA